MQPHVFPREWSECLSVLRAASEEPDAPAVISEAGVVTYGELAARVRRVIRWLRSDDAFRQGFAVVAALRIETIVLLHAAIELGVPLFVIHPRLTGSERAALRELANVPLIDETWTEDVSNLERDAVLSSTDDEPIERRHIPDDAPLAILFTSGSTGDPKGVVLSRRAFVASALGSAENLGWHDDDRWLLCMPLGHVGGLSVVVRCLLARRPVVVLSWTVGVDRFLARIAEHRVTILSLVPTMLRKIFDESPAARFPPFVRVVMLGGDASSASLLAEAVARGVPVVTTYGLTEACSQVATQRYGEPARISQGVGAPLAGVDVRIVAGEIQVRGPTVMTGYFPEGRWPLPFVDGDWLATGDLGHFDSEGHLHVSGRRSEMIITGGENVYPREIERVLATCPGVADVCVFGLADERWGQIVAAAIAPTKSEAPPPAEEIRTFAAAHLASHKRPRVIVYCSSFPLNAVGKLDRKRVAAELSTAAHEKISK